MDQNISTYSTPSVGGTITAVLLDLEPNLAKGNISTILNNNSTNELDLLRLRHEGCAVIVGTASHVGQRRTNVGVRPQRPVQVDGGASGHISSEVGRAGADNATIAVAAALDVGNGHIGDGAVALDGPGDTLGGGRGVRVGVGLVELVAFTANGGVGNVAVAVDQRGVCDETCEVLHFVLGFFWF